MEDGGVEKPGTLGNLALFSPLFSPLQTSGGLSHLLSLPSPLLAQSGLSLSELGLLPAMNPIWQLILAPYDIACMAD